MPFISVNFSRNTKAARLTDCPDDRRSRLLDSGTALLHLLFGHFQPPISEGSGLAGSSAGNDFLFHEQGIRAFQVPPPSPVPENSLVVLLAGCC